MGRKKLQLSDDEKRERLNLQKKKYRESEKGRKTQSECNKRYQKTDSYLKYKREYERKKRC